MVPMQSAHRALDRLANTWPLKGYFQRSYERDFADNENKNLFRGVFESFSDAQSSAPDTRPLGYDNSASATMYLERTKVIYPTDYPVMFWLQRLFEHGCTSVFDLGGHIGVSYYAYRRYLNYPSMLNWVVHDVPAVMANGRQFAAEKDKDGYLSFSDEFDVVNSKDILFALGSLQYLPDTLADRLEKIPEPPKHLILNLTPLHDELSYFTLQSVGTAFCPYRVTSVPAFLASLDRLGYSMVDHWHNPEKKCDIPFFPKHSLDSYHGFYFRRL